MYIFMTAHNLLFKQNKKVDKKWQKNVLKNDTFGTNSKIIAFSNILCYFTNIYDN